MLVNKKTGKVLQYIKDKTKDGEPLVASLNEIGAAIGLPAYQVSRELIKLRTAGLVEAIRGARNEPSQYRYIPPTGEEDDEVQILTKSQSVMNMETLMNSLPAPVRQAVNHYFAVHNEIMRLKEENEALKAELARLRERK